MWYSHLCCELWAPPVTWHDHRRWLQSWLLYTLLSPPFNLHFVLLFDYLTYFIWNFYRQPQKLQIVNLKHPKTLIIAGKTCTNTRRKGEESPNPYILTCLLKNYFSVCSTLVSSLTLVGWVSFNVQFSCSICVHVGFIWVLSPIKRHAC